MLPSLGFSIPTPYLDHQPIVRWPQHGSSNLFFRHNPFLPHPTTTSLYALSTLSSPPNDHPSPFMFSLLGVEILFCFHSYPHALGARCFVGFSLWTQHRKGQARRCPLTTMMLQTLGHMVASHLLYSTKSLSQTWDPFLTPNSPIFLAWAGPPNVTVCFTPRSVPLSLPLTHFLISEGRTLTIC